MSHPPVIRARVEPALRDRVKAEADRRFEGNESLMLREAVRTYLRLRDTLGPRFEQALDVLAPRDGNEESAA